MQRKLIDQSSALKMICVAAALLLGQAASSEPPAATESRTNAPTTDRVGFPKDYRTRFKMLGVTVRKEAPEVLTAYANEQAASIASRAKPPFPEGSIIVMEFSYALRDNSNQIKRDANGAVQKGAVEHVDVMKRGKNFGEAYGASRSGEWEYAGYRLDGTYTTAPQDSGACAACHRGAGAENDFVFRMRPPAANANGRSQ